MNFYQYQLLNERARKKKAKIPQFQSFTFYVLKEFEAVKRLQSKNILKIYLFQDKRRYIKVGDGGELNPKIIKSCLWKEIYAIDVSQLKVSIF